MRYHICFIGRARGSLGVYVPMCLTLEASDPDDFRAKVYEQWEPYLSIEKPIKVRIVPQFRLEGERVVDTGGVDAVPWFEGDSTPSFTHGLIVEVSGEVPQQERAPVLGLTPLDPLDERVPSNEADAQLRALSVDPAALGEEGASLASKFQGIYQPSTQEDRPSVQKQGEAKEQTFSTVYVSDALLRRTIGRMTRFVAFRADGRGGFIEMPAGEEAPPKSADDPKGTP